MRTGRRLPQVLVVDDSPERLAAFRRQFGPAATYVTSYAAAVETLTASTFDEVWLDFDLGGRKNGTNLAFWLRRLPQQRRPRVVIHSENPAGALAMFLTLRSGFRVEMCQPPPLRRHRRGA